MRKISQNEKKEVSGGIGPMILWVALAGSCMVASTLMNIAEGFTDMCDRNTYVTSNNDSNKSETTTKKQNYSYYSRESSFKVTPNPMWCSFTTKF